MSETICQKVHVRNFSSDIIYRTLKSREEGLTAVNNGPVFDQILALFHPRDLVFFPRI